jgi:radical SAM family uncharacterized protein
MADFIDAFVIGDGEEVIEDIVDAYQKTRQDGRGKVLGALARIEGIYVPAFYTVEYNDDRTIKNFVPKDPDVSRTVKKRVVKDFANAHYPTDQIVPNIQTVHDRITIEIMRGCRHACAFCEACAVYAPCRERPKERVLEIARRTYAETGYDEISLLSLSSGDHSQIVDIMRQLNEEFRAKSVSVSMPSLRVEDILKNLPTLISEVKKSGLTFAPEAGSDRLRAKINKRIDLNKLYEAVLESYRAGWRRVKLYFMIGLPTEEDKDLDDIIAVVKKISSLRMEVDSAPANVAVSVNAFIPKPHTQLERSGMEENASISRKKERLRSGLKSRSIEFSSHPAVMSRLEAVFSRGDRKLGEAIYLSWRLGARFDGWQELVRKDIWDKAFLDSGIDPEFYSSRQRSVQEILPWGFIRLR